MEKDLIAQVQESPKTVVSLGGIHSSLVIMMNFLFLTLASQLFK